MVFWSLTVQDMNVVSWLNFSEIGGSIFPDCWFSQAVISTLFSQRLTHGKPLQRHPRVLLLCLFYTHMNKRKVQSSQQRTWSAKLFLGPPEISYLLIFCLNYTCHPEFGVLCITPTFHRTTGLECGLLTSLIYFVPF